MGKEGNRYWNSSWTIKIPNSSKQDIDTRKWKRAKAAKALLVLGQSLKLQILNLSGTPDFRAWETWNLEVTDTLIRWYAKLIEDYSVFSLSCLSLNGCRTTLPLGFYWFVGSSYIFRTPHAASHCAPLTQYLIWTRCNMLQNHLALVDWLDGLR